MGSPGPAINPEERIDLLVLGRMDNKTHRLCAWYHEGCRLTTCHRGPDPAQVGWQGDVRPREPPGDPVLVAPGPISRPVTGLVARPLRRRPASIARRFRLADPAAQHDGRARRPAPVNGVVHGEAHAHNAGPSCRRAATPRTDPTGRTGDPAGGGSRRRPHGWAGPCTARRTGQAVRRRPLCLVADQHVEVAVAAHHQRLWLLLPGSWQKAACHCGWKSAVAGTTAALCRRRTTRSCPRAAAGSGTPSGSGWLSR
jgi:hypothetical protein